MSAQPLLTMAEFARHLYDAGILAFPASSERKYPIVKWGAQRFPPSGWPTRAEVVRFFALSDATRLFIPCGVRSQGITCIDFDQPSYFEAWVDLIAPALLDRLYIEQSQRSGGYHVVFRVASAPPSQKIAKDPRKDNGDDGELRIEVRGEGNGFIAAPSVGYQWLQGNLLSLPTLNDDEYASLTRAAESFNECEEPPVVERPRRAPRIATEDELPGTRYSRENGQREVLDLFRKHGYEIGRPDHRGNVPITRPGASSETSGNVNRDGILHMFSTNTPFIPSIAGKGNPYTPFAAYTWLEHRGDYAAAGKTLYRLYNPPALRVVRDRTMDEGMEEEAGEKESDGIRRYRTYSDEELEHLPTPEFIIDELIPEKSLIAFVGASGSFKTFGVLDVALSIASGSPYHGHAVRQGRVVYVSAEGGAGFGLRVKAWKKHHHISSIPFFRAILDAPQLIEDENETALVATINDEDGVELIIVDTLARTFAGGEENSAKEMGAYIAACDRIRRATGATVALIHHHGVVGGRARGSSAFYAALDAEITFIREEERDNVKMTWTKAKDFGEPDDLHFTRVVIDLDDDQTSLILSPLQVTKGPVRIKERRRKHVVALYAAGLSGLRFTEWMIAAQSSKTTHRRVINELLEEQSVAENEGVYRLTKDGIETYRIALDAYETWGQKGQTEENGSNEGPNRGHFPLEGTIEAPVTPLRTDRTALETDETWGQRGQTGANGPNGPTEENGSKEGPKGPLSFRSGPIGPSPNLPPGPDQSNIDEEDDDGPLF